MVDRVGVNVQKATVVADGHKYCGRCRADRLIADFAPSQVPLAGSWCKKCQAEYRKQRRRAGNDNDTAAPRSVTHCRRCGEDLSGRRADARYCSANCADQVWRQAHPNHVRRWTLRSVYGLTEEQLLAMIEQQGGACAICGDTDPRQWNVDHCHSTGRVRGVLCSHCNTGLGLFRDNTDSLVAAIAYLQRATTN